MMDRHIEIGLGFRVPNTDENVEKIKSILLAEDHMDYDSLEELPVDSFKDEYKDVMISHKVFVEKSSDSIVVFYSPSQVSDHGESHCGLKKTWKEPGTGRWKVDFSTEDIKNVPQVIHDLAAKFDTEVQVVVDVSLF